MDSIFPSSKPSHNRRYDSFYGLLVFCWVKTSEI